MPSFGVMVMLGFLVGLFLARKRAQRFGFQPDQMSDVTIWVLVSGILGARLGYIVQELPYYSKNPDKLLTLRFEGLTSFGGVILAVIALVFVAKRMKAPPFRLMDAIAPSFLVGNIFGRIGCLLNGCCYGGRCDLPWGITVKEAPGLHHPAQIYDGLMDLAALLLFLFVVDRPSLRLGQATGYALAGYGVSRFVYEFFRAGTTSTTIGNLPITEGHVAAILVALAGGVLWVLGRSKEVAEV